VGVKSFSELAVRFAALLGLSVVADKTGDAIFGASEEKTQEQVNAYLRNLAAQLDSRGIRVKRCVSPECPDFPKFSLDTLRAILGAPANGVALTPEEIAAARRQNIAFRKDLESLLANSVRHKARLLSSGMLIGIGHSRLCRCRSAGLSTPSSGQARRM
jgi:hypothetical protein